MFNIKRIIKGFLIFVFSCSVQSCISQQKKSIQGTWTDSEDKKSILKFVGNKYFQLYNLDTVYSGVYFRDSVSCDSAYYNGKKNNLDFIRMDDGSCYEITGLTDSTLAYRHTISGKIALFIRSQKQTGQKKGKKN